MIIRAQIDGRPYAFDPKDTRHVIGEGGEAIVMHWTPPVEFGQKFGKRKYVVKLFTMEGNTAEETKVFQFLHAARQQKLRKLPQGLPANAIMPVCLVYDASGRQIIGYVMPLLEDVKPLSNYMKMDFRRQNGITQQDIVRMLLNLHALLMAVHKAGVVAGDFNDKNVLVNRKGEVFLVDMDSAQWGQWQSRVAMLEFADPTLLNQKHALRDNVSYSRQSDWYSFTVMVFQLLLLHHPYRDGVHRPVQTPGRPIKVRLRFADRVTRRLSTFDPTVHLDATSTFHPDALPDLLREFMRAVFVQNRRANPFPTQLLTAFRWMICPKCNRQHGRSVCLCGAPGITPLPGSTPPPPATGRRAASRVAPATHAPQPTPAPTPTTYLAAAAPQGKLQLVYYKDGAYRREDGSIILQNAYNPAISALVAGNRTVFATGSSFVVMNGSVSSAKKYETQARLGQTTVAANSRHVYWVNEGSLVRDDPRGIVTIGPVAPHMTSVWAGEQFGVAMVQAGILTRILTFDAERTGFIGSVSLPPEFGTVTDAQCVIGETYAWLVVTARAANGAANTTCYMLDRQAQIRATGSAQGNTWLSHVSAASLAAGDKLFVPQTRTGIVQIGTHGHVLREQAWDRAAADLLTDRDATIKLCLTTDGLTHVGPTSISLIKRI